MPERARIVRIVVASPSDVSAERAIVPRVVEDLNNGIAADRELRLEVIRWETDTYPGFHAEGPQGLIDTILRIEDGDVVIGIFWKRFGTTTTDGTTGTEHEIRRAYQAWERQQRPQIMVYFNQKPSTPQSEEEAGQWGRVLRFRNEFPKQGLWWPYKGTTEFERLLRAHLTNFIRDKFPIERPRPFGGQVSGRREAKEAKRKAEADSGVRETAEEEPVIQVDPNSRDCNTIMTAVRMAGLDYRVEIKEGVYRESVIVDKPIQITGLGDREKVVIESAYDNVISFEATHGRIANLTIRYVGTDHSAVKITRGRLELEDCDITSRGLSCVSIQHGAEPLVRGNHIHDGRQEGIYAGEGASGAIENNKIYMNGLAGVAIWRTASPTVRGNEIYGCKEGIYVGDRGSGLIENNKIHDNRGPGIKTEGGEPTLGPNEEYRNNLGGR